MFLWPLVKISLTINVTKNWGNKTLAKSDCVILDRVRNKNLWIQHVDRYIGNCLNITKQYKKMSLLTRRALHHSAGIASHTLLMIMFKDIPLLFWLIPFCRILINSHNYLGKCWESLNQTLWKQDIRNNVTNNIWICNKILKKSNTQLVIFLHYFANLIKSQHVQEWHGYKVQKEPDKQTYV